MTFKKILNKGNRRNMLIKLPPDPRFRAARLWSNREIEKIAPFVQGKVLNVSGWRDEDKEGRTYHKSYFVNCSEYWISNWKSDARGFQGDLPNEFFFDLELDLNSELEQNFDMVFNHTTLEHVFDIFKAFENLCALSRDMVVVVVPFLQEQHGDYGDYWRMTPWGIKRLFHRCNVEPAYINYNDSNRDAIYVIGAGARKKETIDFLRNLSGNQVDKVEKTCIGTKHFDGEYKVTSLIKKLSDVARRFLGLSR